jgi:hypothetical protein
VVAQIVEVGGDGGRSSGTGVAIRGVSGSRVSLSAVLNKTVIVSLLDPLVDHDTAPVCRHLGTEDGSLVVKGSGLGSVATDFGEENGNVVISDVLGQLFVTRHLISRVSTPLIA